MIVRWLIGACALLSAARANSFIDSVDLQRLTGINITEKTGMACAYADFNHDRLTDVLHYHAGKLYVLLQFRQDFTNENEDTTQNLIIDLKGEFDEVACSVGDLNGDGNHDIVVSTREKKQDGHWNVNYFLYIEDKNKTLCHFEQGNRKYTAKDQVALIDVTGDGVHDVVGVHPNGTLLCVRGEIGKKDDDGKLIWPISPLSRSCEEIFPGWENSGQLHNLMPTLFADVTNDLEAEIIFMRHNESGLRPEIWERTGSDWKKMKQQPELQSGLSFKYTLAPMLADLDLNAVMDLIVPVCKDEKCTIIESLLVTHWKGDGWEDWAGISIDLGDQSTLVEEEGTLARMRVGDANLDGYPDLLVTMKKKGGVASAAVIENYPVGEYAPKRRFQISQALLVMPGLSIGRVKSSSFFDFSEDGYLDILVQWTDGTSWQWSLCISDSEKQGDVTFLKVQTFLPLPENEDISGGKGVVWGGACTSYEMETTGIGEQRKAIECQMPGNSHKAGLSPPFSLFGLGRNPNFVDVARFRVPRATDNGDFKSHKHDQIVPNARMMVQPPRLPDDSWVLRLYLTPSTLILSSLLVMASTCTMLLIVVLVLHFREKKLDRVERAAQSHRFHFDAM